MAIGSGGDRGTFAVSSVSDLAMLYGGSEQLIIGRLLGRVGVPAVFCTDSGEQCTNSLGFHRSLQWRWGVQPRIGPGDFLALLLHVFRFRKRPMSPFC